MLKQRLSDGYFAAKEALQDWLGNRNVARLAGIVGLVYVLLVTGFGNRSKKNRQKNPNPKSTFGNR